MTGRAGLRRWRASKWVCKNTTHTHRCTLHEGARRRQHARQANGAPFLPMQSQSRERELPVLSATSHALPWLLDWPSLCSGVARVTPVVSEHSSHQAWVHVCTSVAGKRGRTVTAPRSDCRANALAPSLTVHRLRTLQRLKAPSPTGSIALRDQIKVSDSKRVGGSRIPS